MESQVTMSEPNVLAISGVKNSGKTTLISKIIDKLSALGYKVSVLKHDGHSYDPEPEGTDTHAYFEAGAHSWAIYDEEKFSFSQKSATTSERLLPLFKDSDLVLIEGLKNSDYPKLELMRKINGREPVCKHETVLAYITDFNFVADQPVFNFNDIDNICKFIVERLSL